MQYAVSDIHGCYDKYIELLRRINLKATDTLYILGDVIDRGPDGLKILLDVSLRPNIVPFLGNHEYAALACLPWLMEELTEENTEPDVLLWRLKSVQGWMADGGDKTVEEFRRLSPAARQDVLDILEDLTVYEETEAGGRTFVLVHAGLGGFSPDMRRGWKKIDGRPGHGPDTCPASCRATSLFFPSPSRIRVTPSRQPAKRTPRFHRGLRRCPRKDCLRVLIRLAPSWPCSPANPSEVLGMGGRGRA